MLVLLTGGARGGKSDLAVKLAAGQAMPVTFIASAQPGDREMARRIERHRSERPPQWQTIEEPLSLERAIQTPPDRSCLVIDCLTLWVANALTAFSAPETETLALSAAKAAAGRQGLSVVVTNEVGLGLVPDNALGRSYRDLLGRVNTIWAAAANHVLLVISGRVVALADAQTLIGTLS